MRSSQASAIPRPTLCPRPATGGRGAADGDLAGVHVDAGRRAVFGTGGRCARVAHDGHPLAVDALDDRPARSPRPGCRQAPRARPWSPPARDPAPIRPTRRQSTLPCRCQARPIVTAVGLCSGLGGDRTSPAASPSSRGRFRHCSWGGHVDGPGQEPDQEVTCASAEAVSARKGSTDVRRGARPRTYPASIP